jgi:hypothetical protein
MMALHLLKIRKSEFTLALRGNLTYDIHLMRLNALLIVSLLAIFIAAPIVDAIACDDCNDILSLQDMLQRVTIGADHSAGNLLSSDGNSPEPQETGTEQDLCPVCANIAAAMDNACCGVPTMISQRNHLPKLIALSDPSYSITKPPQI